MPLIIQILLLTVLQEKLYQRLMKQEKCLSLRVTISMLNDTNLSIATGEGLFYATIV